MTVIIGFLVNPIAGMGGSVGLKGTDGADTQEEAVRRGASKSAPDRASITIHALRAKDLDLGFLTCFGDMGGDLLRAEGLDFEVIHIPGEVTTALDTKQAAKAFADRGVDLLLFCGGDGTARDIVEEVGTSVTLVGIPGGVKMHSSVFALSPEDAAHLVESYAKTGQTRDAEVLDVDEDEFRAGRARPRLFSIARVVDDTMHLQSSKSAFYDKTASAEAEELGAFIAETMEPGILYLVGPGSTTEAIASAIGQEKTSLGVDAYIDRRLVDRDMTESDILDLLRKHDRRRIVVTPIGSQGFIFGRGNQQLSPEVIRRVGARGIVVVATPTKLRGTPVLHVDTGDEDVDENLRMPMKVLTGRGRKRLMRVV
ncbi:MAG: ATP-NAD kinase family protein [Methanobacteriota archaeon]|nr:MAG: ATP-NAD kinase family protein [Euryarchaeota archaeon]